MNKMGYYIYILFFVVSFFLSQYYFFNYYFILKKWNYFLFVYYFIISILFLIGGLKKLNLFYFVAVIIFSFAWYITYKFEFSFLAFSLYGIFFLFVFLSYMLFERRSKDDLLNTNKIYNNKNSNVNLIFFILWIIIITIFISYPYLVTDLFLEITNNTINQPMLEFSFHEFFVSYIFHTPKVYLSLSLYLLVLIIGVMFFLNNKIKNEILALLFIMIMTFLIKFITIFIMYGNGFEWMKQIMNNRMIFDHYVFARDIIKNIGDFLKDYNSIQLQQMGMAARIRTHPPLLTIIYWLLCKISGCSPLGVGFGVMFLTSFTVITIYFIIKILLNSKEAGFIGSIFYLISANNIVQSKIISDSITAFIFSLIILLLVIANKYRKIWIFFVAGLLFGIETYMQFAAWQQLLIVFPFFFFKKNLTIENILISLKMLISFISGLIAFHLFFPLIFYYKFNYITSFKIALSYLNQDNAGVLYTTWWWLNAIHLLQYAGSGITVLFILRFWNSLTGKIKIDTYSLISLVYLAIIITSATIRGVLAWKYMYLIVLIIPPAIISLFYKEGQKLKYNKLILTFLIITTYCETMFYEFFIRDAQ